MCKNIINEVRKIFRGLDNQFSGRCLSRMTHQFTHQATSFKSRFPRTDLVQISGHLNLSMRRTVNRVCSRPLRTYHDSISEFAHQMIPVRSSPTTRRPSSAKLSWVPEPFFGTDMFEVEHRRIHHLCWCVIKTNSFRR